MQKRLKNTGLDYLKESYDLVAMMLLTIWALSLSLSLSLYESIEFVFNLCC